MIGKNTYTRAQLRAAFVRWMRAARADQAQIASERGRGAGDKNEFHIVEKGPYAMPDGWRMGTYSVNGWNFLWSEGQRLASGEYGESHKRRECARRGVELIRDALRRGAT